jgi:hypothetical protein
MGCCWPRIGWGCGIRSMASDTLREIEENQEALRESIEESKRLAERNEALLKRHREMADLQKNA